MKKKNLYVIYSKKYGEVAITLRKDSFENTIKTWTKEDYEPTSHILMVNDPIANSDVFDLVNDFMKNEKELNGEGLLYAGCKLIFTLDSGVTVISIIDITTGSEIAQADYVQDAKDWIDEMLRLKSLEQL